MDEKIIPPRKSFIARTLLTIMAVFIASLILLQILFIAGMAWINTPSGQSWIERSVSMATGYQVNVRKVSFIGLHMLEIGNITLADKDGEFLQAKDVFMALNVPALLNRHLTVSLRSENLALNRIPQSGVQKPAGGPLMAPFVLPDFYFRQINLDGLNIVHLSLSKAVAGQDLTLSPDVSASISRDRNHYAITLKASPGSGTLAFFPHAISFNGAIDTDQALVTITSLDVKGDAYDLVAQGQAGLDEQGVATLQVAGDVKDLTKLAITMPGTLHMQGTVSGLSNDPDLSLQSVAQLTAYTAKGLEDVQANVQVHHLLSRPEGLAALQTVFQKKAIALKTEFSLENKTLSLTDIKGDAPDLSLQGNLVLNTATMQAEGRLQAEADAATYKDLAGVDAAGKLNASAIFSVKDGLQGLALTSSIANPRFQTLRAEALTLALDVADIRALWPDHADIGLRGADLPDLALNKIGLKLVRQDDDHYALTLAGQGRAQKPFSLSGSALLSGKSVEEAALKNANLKLSSGRGTLSLKGDLLPDQVNMNLISTAFPLNALLVSADALMNGKAAFTGPLAMPVVKADFILKPTKNIARGSQLAVTANYQEKTTNATITGTGKGIHKLAGQMTFPGQFSLRPFIINLPPSTPLKGGLNADLDLGILSSFVPPDIVLTGSAQANIAIGGTIGKPDANGTASLLRGSFEQISSGIMLTGIAAKTSFKNGRLVLESFQASDSTGGSLEGNGNATLDAEKRADVMIKAQNLNPFHNNTFINGPVSADVKLGGVLNHYVLRGTVQTGAMNITIPERFSGNIPRLNIVQKKTAGLAKGNPLEGIALDIVIHAANRIFVRGWGLDAEFGGDLQAGGTLSAPLVNGTLDSKRGRYEEFGKRFDITQGHLRFQGTVPPSPYLDITAETKADDITAIVALSGPVSAPTVKLSSTPALPDDEVLSRILFGKDISKISPFQAIQIAQTLRRFSGKGGSGGLDPLGMLRSATHLDDLEVNTSESGETTVGAGKYLTDKVYVSVESGADQKSSVGKVQIDVAPHVKVETKIGQEAQTGAGVLWQWDY